MLDNMAPLKDAMEQMDAQDPVAAQAAKNRAAQILKDAKLSFAQLAELIEERRLLLRPKILAGIKRMDHEILGDVAFRNTGSALRKEGQSFRQIAEAIELNGGPAPRHEDPVEPSHEMAGDVGAPAPRAANAVASIVFFLLRHPLQFLAIALLAIGLAYIFGVVSADRPRGSGASSAAAPTAAAGAQATTASAASANESTSPTPSPNASACPPTSTSCRDANGAPTTKITSTDDSGCRERMKELGVVSNGPCIDVSDIVENLRKGDYSFNDPKEAYVGEAFTIRLVLKTSDKQDIQNGLRELQDEVVTKSGKFAQSIEATLHGDDFVVEPKGSIARTATLAAPVKWEWKVTAQSSGKKTLVVEIWANIQAGSDKHRVQINTLYEPLVIEVSTFYDRDEPCWCPMPAFSARRRRSYPDFSGTAFSAKLARWAHTARRRRRPHQQAIDRAGARREPRVTGHTGMRRGMNLPALQVQEALRRDPHGGLAGFFPSWLLDRYEKPAQCLTPEASRIVRCVFCWAERIRFLLSSKASETSQDIGHRKSDA